MEIMFDHKPFFHSFQCNIVVVPTMAFGTHIYSGLLYQIVCNLKQRKDKMTVDVIAAGGRYDALLQHYRFADVSCFALAERILIFNFVI